MMNILYIRSTTHHKNDNFIVNCKKIKFHIINSTNDLDSYDLSQFDAVLSPCIPIDISKYPTVKFIFGPHFSVLPDANLNKIRGKNCVYNNLSDWVIKLWSPSPLCNNIKLIALPFGVDTDLFTDIKPIDERTNIFVYYKQRHPDEMNMLNNFLKNKDINFVFINYSTKYNEKDYINCLHNSKFGIWLGRHESQGFALEESLSCNVPLLVWDVKSLNQEYGYSYPDVPATVIPYWDERCGEFFHEFEDLEKTFNLFLSKLNTYKPREYILEKLSVDVCENRFIETIHNIDI
jgi:hypothetical protein